MRISDWSSYVCSSDLVTYGIVKAFANKFDQLTVLQLDAHSDLREAYEDNPYSHASVMKREIGRASCRERVCQYVSISVVYVTLKKKQHQRTTDTKDLTITGQQVQSRNTLDQTT